MDYQECSPLLVTELVHPQHRAVYSSIYNSLWYVGSLIGACVALGMSSLQRSTPSAAGRVSHDLQAQTTFNTVHGHGVYHVSCKVFPLSVSLSLFGKSSPFSAHIEISDY